jgi:hypothetical protein
MRLKGFEKSDSSFAIARAHRGKTIKHRVLAEGKIGRKAEQRSSTGTHESPP